MKCTVKLDRDSLFRMMMYLYYMRKLLIVMAVITIYGAVMIAVSLSRGSLRLAGMFAFVVCFFTVFQPIFLKMRASSMLKTNPAYAKPMSYAMDEEGCSVTQEEHKSYFTWDEIDHVTFTKWDIVLHVDKGHAYLIPRNSIPFSHKKIEDFIHNHVDRRKEKKIFQISL